MAPYVGGWILMAIVMFGCSSNQQSVRVSNLINNMSPEFETLALSRQQRLIRQAHALDVNARQLADDVDQLFLIYRPLRLSIFAVP